MGTAWNSVLVSATSGDVATLARALGPLLPYVRPQIRVSLQSFVPTRQPDVRSLELAGINKKPLALQPHCGMVEVALSTATVPNELLDRCRHDAEFGLAVALSAAGVDATWIFHSDGTSQSAAVSLSGTAVSSVDWTDAASCGGDYGRAGVTAVRRFLPEVQDIDDLFGIFYGDDAVFTEVRLVVRGETVGI